MPTTTKRMKRKSRGSRVKKAAKGIGKKISEGLKRYWAKRKGKGKKKDSGPSKVKFNRKRRKPFKGKMKR